MTGTKTTVAVAGGTGGVGVHITRGLLANDHFNVVVLTRASSEVGEKSLLLDEFKSHGATIVSADYSDEAGLAKALKGVDVVVSALAAGVQADSSLLSAAKTAGVKRFIPSHFGVDHSSEVPKNTPLFGGKYAFMDAIEKSGLEWTYIENGFFTDQAFFPLSWNDGFAKVLDGEVSLVGDGNTKFSLMHRADVGRYVAAILEDWEGSKNKRITVATDTLTLNEVVALFEKLTGNKITVTYRPVAEVKAKVFELIGTDFYATIPDQLNLTIAEGGAEITKPLNKNYPKVTNLITLEPYLKSVLPGASRAKKSVAVAGGTGGVGIHITKALLASNAFDVTVLTRAGAEAGDKSRLLDDLKEHGAKLVPVDYEDEAALSKALAGVDVVVSTLAAGVSADATLLSAAKAAGVKRIVPSHFGVDHSSDVPRAIPLFGGKYAFMEAIEKSGLEWTYIENGFFTDLTFYPATWNSGFAKVLEGEVSVVGDGNTKFSLTHRADVGRYVAAILEDWEGSKNRRITLATDTLTLNEVVALFEKLTGSKITVTYRPVAEVKAKVFELIGTDFYATIPDQLNLTIAEGGAEIFEPMNSHYPKVTNPITLEAYLKSVLPAKN